MDEERRDPIVDTMFRRYLRGDLDRNLHCYQKYLRYFDERVDEYCKNAEPVPQKCDISNEHKDVVNFESTAVIGRDITIMGHHMRRGGKRIGVTVSNRLNWETP